MCTIIATCDADTCRNNGANLYSQEPRGHPGTCPQHVQLPGAACNEGGAVDQRSRFLISMFPHASGSALLADKGTASEKFYNRAKAPPGNVESENIHVS